MFRNIFNNSNFGLVIDWKFHKGGKWVSALTPYLVDKIIHEFNPIIISSQHQYEKNKNKLKYLISLEPGWAAPKIQYSDNIQYKAVFYSDPHFETKKRYEYFLSGKFSHIFSYYDSPFFYHFKDFKKEHPEKFVHMPWAIPEEFVNKKPLEVHSNTVNIFGGRKSEAYDFRNWCREQKEVKNYHNSGVENKVMTDEEYFEWLSGFDAIIAAGSTDPKYDLTTPKYFEIASAGALLFGQETSDLDKLGFNTENMIIINKNNFHDEVRKFKQNPEKYLGIREKGRELILSRHLIRHRIEKIKEVFNISKN